MELMGGSTATSSEYIWERQQNFLNAMSHELKTPLARIIASVELIKKTNPEFNEMNKSLDVIYSEAFRMAKLTDDMLLLTASYINHHSVNLEEIEIDSLLISVFETYQPICKKHNIKFDLLLSDISYPILYSDKHSITQILAAFLDNALSHAKNSTRIQITTSCTKSTFTIYVVDHGCGIPDEVKPYIFDPFFCGDASHTDRSHFGLGLSIAQSLVKGLNGSIGILDTDGGGTTFILNLPLDHRIAVSSPKNVSEKL